MAYSAPPTQTYPHRFTEAEWNQLVDCILATAVATVTAAGDIPYATAANALARLGIGSAGQVLQVNVGATAPQWASVGAPTGAVTPFAGSSAPTGWLLCDGTAVSRTTYAALFAVIGTTYGTGDGSTTFNLPNLKGRVPVGYDAAQIEFDTLGKTGGEKTHALLSGELASHSHAIAGPSGLAGNHTHTVSSYSVTSNGAHAHQLNGVGAQADSAGSHTHDVRKNSDFAIGSTYTVHTGNVGDLVGDPTESGGAHTHTLSGQSTSVADHGHGISLTLTTEADHSHTLPANTDAAGSGTAHQNLQPYLALNYILKT